MLRREFSLIFLIGQLAFPSLVFAESRPLNLPAKESLWLSCECAVQKSFKETVHVKFYSDADKICGSRDVSIDAGSGDLEWTRKMIKVTDRIASNQTPAALCKQMEEQIEKITLDTLRNEFAWKFRDGQLRSSCGRTAVVGLSVSIRPPVCDTHHFMYFTASPGAQSKFVSEGHIPKRQVPENDFLPQRPKAPSARPAQDVTQ